MSRRNRKRDYAPPRASDIESRLRSHKGMTFTPLYRGSKRSINTILTTKRTIPVEDPMYGGRAAVVGRLADKRYFRIYKHKGQQYTLYIGPEKVSHGGLRHKPKEKGTTAIKRLKEQKMADIVQQTNAVDISDYDLIQYGPHEGKYFHKKTGKIYTEEQIKIMVAQRGIKRSG